MKSSGRFIVAVLLVLLADSSTLQAQNCLPSSFIWQAPTLEYSSICFGYAQARAFGCSDDVAVGVITFSIQGAFFQRRSGGLNGVQVGDIVVWYNDGLMAHSHAAYVSGVQIADPVPGGKDRLGMRGSVHEENPAATVTMSMVTVDHVSGMGQPSATNQSLLTVHNTRMLETGERFEGVYELIPAALGTYKITFQNSFPGGYMQIGKNGSTWINRDSLPYSTYKPKNAEIPARAEDQEVAGTKWAFNPSTGWTISNGSRVFTTREVNVVVGNIDQTYTANFSTASSTSWVQFKLASDTVFIGGDVEVNGVERKSPTEQYPVGASAAAKQSLMIDRVYYTFSQWKYNGAFYSSNRTIAPTSPGLYVAYYTFGYVLHPDELSIGPSGEYDNIQLQWRKNVSSFVDQFQIWRQVKFNKQVVEPLGLVATLQSTATQYIDYDYTFVGGFSSWIIDYDVKARYRVNGAVSGPNTLSTFADIGMAEASDQEEPGETSERPEKLWLSAHPNPFNPSTTISIVLNEDAHIELTLCDLWGRTVARLEKGSAKAGHRAFTWTAIGDDGQPLPSGIYFARLFARHSDGAAPVVLSKKLLLLK